MPKPPRITKDRVPLARPVRLQPPGLRMRYRPFGADALADNAADFMDIDVDHSEAGSPERTKKRQKGTANGEKKKNKKHREGK